MRGRGPIVISVALNLLLAAAVVGLWDNPPPDPQHPTRARPIRYTAKITTNQPGTHVVVRRQFFSWAEVESEDYRAYIANLRDIGCPEETIRDIIVADVTEFYERRRLREIVPEDPPWWKGSPQAEVAQSITRQQNALDAERRALLTGLLGPGWEPQRTQLAGMVFFTGPVLGALPEVTKLAVQDIIARSVEREREWRREHSGEPDAATQTRFRQATREELAKVLTAGQLEEYLLRWSFNAGNLRRQLAGFEVTPDQFRSLFRALDPLEQQLQSLTNAADPSVPRLRAQLNRQIEQAYQQALGEKRYAQMKLNEDPVFVETTELAAKLKVAPELVRPLYEVTRAGAEETRRIREDKTLTTAEQEEALAATLREQADFLRELLGEEGYRAYREARQSAR